MEWLAKNGIGYDLLLFGRDKAEIIRDYISPAVPRYFIEDRAKHALEIAELGISVLLMDIPANSGLSPSPFITRVKDWQEITRRVEETEREVR
jgi:hypothetical protein